MSGMSEAALGPSRPSAGVARLNTRLAVAMAALIALAPVPAASNRPVFWAATALIVALMGVWYAVGLLRAGADPRFSIRQIPLQATLAALFVFGLAMQLVPVSPLLDAVGFPVAALWGSIASPAVSLAPGATLLVLLQWTTYALVYFLMLQISMNPERAQWLIRAIFYIIAAHAAYAIIALAQLGDPMLIFEKWAYEGVATGTFVNRNSFATFVAFGLVVGMALLFRDAEAYFESRKGGPRIGGNVNWSRMLVDAVAMLTLATALVASQSRGGVLAAAIGCGAVLAVYASRRRASGSRPVLVFVGLALAAGVATLTFYGGGLFERIGSLEASSDVDIRTSLYGQVLGMIGERPWIGYGGGAFEAAFPYFHRLPVSADVVWDKAHSTYLALWAEMGVIGGTLPLVLIAAMGWRLFRAASSRPRDWALPLAGFGVIVVAAVHSLVDFSLEIEANALTFVAIVALGMTGALARRQKLVPAKTRHASLPDW